MNVLPNASFENIMSKKKKSSLKKLINLKLNFYYKSNKITKKIDEVNINLWNTLLKGEFIKNYEIFDEDSIYVENSEISSQEEKSDLISSNSRRLFL